MRIWFEVVPVKVRATTICCNAMRDDITKSEQEPRRMF